MATQINQDLRAVIEASLMKRDYDNMPLSDIQQIIALAIALARDVTPITPLDYISAMLTDNANSIANKGIAYAPSHEEG